MTDISTAAQTSRSNWFRQLSEALRFVLVIVIIVALMIPLFLVWLLVEERNLSRDQAQDQVANAWAGEQTIIGPYLLVETEDESSNKSTLVETVYMPIELHIEKLRTFHEIRRRGIYEIPVFTAVLEGEATYSPIEIGSDVLKVIIVFGLSDVRGIRTNNAVYWNDEELTNYSTSQTDLGKSINLELPSESVEEGGTLAFSLEYRGSKRFSVYPVGEISKITMSSDWPHPSFNGRFLPDSSEVTPDGFTASWTVNALARGHESVMTKKRFAFAIGELGGEFGPGGAWGAGDIGFSVLSLDSPYRDIDRAIKYGVLFVVLTLVSVLCIELVSKMRFHIIQYGVVGIALVLFFLTLLALTEHVGFAIGYIIAASIVTLMTSSYIWFISHQLKITLTVLIFIATLYASLYLVLQLGQYALLMGTILLLLLLGGMMFATRTLRDTQMTQETSS